jgi:predicted dehydrogenase
VADKARAYGEEFGIAWYTDYRVMLAAHPEIEVVAVITPSGMHYEHASEMISRWGKNVIVEKPTFMRPEQFLDACRQADAKGVRIFPVFQNRHNRAVVRVKKAVESGELGDIRIMAVRVRWCRPQRYYNLAEWRGTFSHDGGALSNQGIHHIDLLRYFGGPVAQVSATMRTLGADIEVEDTVVATMRYASGAVGVLEVTTAARPDEFEASLSIVGSEGLAQIGGIAVNELQMLTTDPGACGLDSEDFSRCVYGSGHEQVYRDIAAAFHHGRPYPVDRGDCLDTLKLWHSFYRSDEAGGVWVDVDSAEQSTRLGRSNEALSNLYRTPE